jgi:hypothetical protein
MGRGPPVLGGPRFTNPIFAHTVAAVVRNVVTALRIYLTMMVSLRSLDLSMPANSFVSAKARKVPFLQNILVETLFVNVTILM